MDVSELNPNILRRHKDIAPQNALIYPAEQIFYGEEDHGIMTVYLPLRYGEGNIVQAFGGHNLNKNEFCRAYLNCLVYTLEKRFLKDGEIITPEYMKINWNNKPVQIRSDNVMVHEIALQDSDVWFVPSVLCDYWNFHRDGSMVVTGFPLIGTFGNHGVVKNSSRFEYLDLE